MIILQRRNWYIDASSNRPKYTQPDQESKKTNSTTATYHHPRITEPNDRTEFLFPQSREMFEHITNKIHLRDLLAEESKKFGVTIQLHSYCFERNDRSYLYSKCIQCGHKQKMKFLKVNPSDQRFKLVYFDNTHNHTNFTKKKKGQYNMVQIFEIMQTTPKNMPIDQFKIHLKKMYDINDSHFYYMLSRFRKFHQSIKSITEYLRKHNAKIWTQIFKIDQAPNQEDAVDVFPEEDPPFFMFVLPQMEANFHRYGECCYLSIRKNLVKKKGVLQNKQWDIIAFNGLSHHNKFAPFALAFVQVTQYSFLNTIEIIKRTFSYFKKTPKTLITPYNDIYGQIVKALNKKNIFNGCHMFDALQQIQDYKKVVSAGQIKFFQDIVCSKYKFEFYQNVQNFFKNVVPTLQMRRLFNNLMKKAPKMCFAMVNTHNFIGSGFKHSGNKFMTLMIRYLYTHNSMGAKNNPIHAKELYPSIKFIAKEYIKIMTPQLPYIQYDTWKFQHFMHIPEMQLIRHRLKVPSMDMFLSEFNKALHVDVRQRYRAQSANGQMKVYDVYDRNSNAIYVIAPYADYTDDKVFNKMIWKCNCLYSLKCGLPCCHELKVTLMNGHSMLDQIHQKWIQVKIGRKKAPGRPKVSRRNNTH